jgi:hypothetical protein
VCRSQHISFRSPWKILPDTVENVDVETVEGVDQVGRGAVPQLQAEGVLISSSRQPLSLNQFGVQLGNTGWPSICLGIIKIKYSGFVYDSLLFELNGTSLNLTTSGVGWRK